MQDIIKYNNLALKDFFRGIKHIIIMDEVIIIIFFLAHELFSHQEVMYNQLFFFYVLNSLNHRLNYNIIGVNNTMGKANDTLLFFFF